MIGIAYGRYRLGAADAADAGQSVCLHLLEQLGNLRDPAALPGWLATTTGRECARVLRAAYHPRAAALLPDHGHLADEHAELLEQELLAAERHATLRTALTCLPSRGQQLFTLLTCDPPMHYAQISATLGIPAGSIGPLRARVPAHAAQPPGHRSPEQHRHRASSKPAAQPATLRTSAKTSSNSARAACRISFGRSDHKELPCPKPRSPRSSSESRSAAW